MWFQKNIVLSAKSRGFHLVTSEIESKLTEIAQVEVGLCHLMLQHTSASLTINENADPTVLSDMNEWFNRNVKENEPYYRHTFEGPDDMPAHIKSIITGCDVTIPIVEGRLGLGVWQGIYLAEFRNRASSRTLVASIY